MMHLLTQAHRDLRPDLFAEMHVWRKRIFVDELGWQLSVCDGGEYDEYDDERALYFVLTDEEGRVAAAQRMRPTDDHSMLADHYPLAVAVKDRPVADPRTWEMTRGFIRPDWRKGCEQRSSVSRFMVAQMATALSFGIDRVVGFTDISLVPWFINSGYMFRLLGLPIPYAEGSGIAFEFQVSPAAIQRLREVWAVDGPVSLTLPTSAAA